MTSHLSYHHMGNGQESLTHRFFTTRGDKTPKEHSLIFESQVDFIRQTEKHNPIRPQKATAIMKNETERI